MSTQKEARWANTGPVRKDHRAGTQEPDASAIVHHSAPVVNIRQRSRLVPASFLSLIGFAVCYLAGHVLAAITGWHWLVYVGVGFGLWWIAACVVAFFVTGAVRHD